MDQAERESIRTPMWCPICEHVLKGGSAGDDKSYFKWGCCRLCFIEFVEDREERWASGWRPSEDDLFRFLKR